MADLYQRYVTEIRPALQEELGIDNVMEVPTLSKVTLNMGVGGAIADRKVMDSAVADLTLISGQKPVVTNARKSEAAFKIREGYPVGCKVTLRRTRMYEFVERLIGITIPRDPRFPRAESPFVRRQGQFFHGYFGADRICRNRLRQDRYDSRAGHHGDDQREVRRSGTGVAPCFWFSISRLARRKRLWQRFP